MWTLSETKVLKENKVSKKNCKNASCNKEKKEYCKLWGREVGNETRLLKEYGVSMKRSKTHRVAKKLRNIAISKELSLKILQDFSKKTLHVWNIAGTQVVTKKTSNIAGSKEMDQQTNRD